MRYRFADFELDDDAYVLHRAGEKIELQPKPFMLLQRLLADGGRVVRKEELLEQLWPDVLVGDASLSRAVRAVRRALGESAEGDGIVRTVRGHGYGIGVPISAVSASGARAGKPPSLRPVASDLVGRKDLLLLLEQRFERARAGYGSVVHVEGEAGIGKSRLLAEAVELLERGGARPLWGRTWEGEGAPAYQPWSRVLRAILRTLTPSRLDRLELADLAPLAAVVPELREQIPGIPLPKDLDPGHARFQLFEACLRLLELGCEEGPLVIALDDMHAADEASVQLLHATARQIHTLPCLITCAWREPGETRAPASLLGSLRREPNVTSIRILPLDEAEVAELVEHAIGEPADRGLVRELQERGQGNPFFILELAHQLRLQPAVRSERPGHVRGERAGEGESVRPEIVIPASIRELVGQRVGALSPECGRALGVASVYGREFPLGIVARAAGLEPDELLELLEEAELHDIVTRVPGSLERHRFAHSLVRDSLYESLGARDRVRLHQQLASMLELAYERASGPYLTELAYHFGAAAAGGAQPEKAQEYAGRAADKAMEQLAYEEAARGYGLALAALETRVDPPPHEQCDLLLRLGAAYGASGATEEAGQAFDRAATLARSLGDAHQLAHAALGRSGENVGFSDPALPDPLAESLLEESLRAVGEGSAALRVRLLGALAMRLYWTPARPRSDSLTREAIALSDRSGDPGLRALALARRHTVLWHAGGLDERLDRAGQIASLAREAGEELLLVQSHQLAVLNQLELGDMAQIRAKLASYAELADQLRLPQQRYLASVLGTTCDLVQGRFESAERGIARAQEIGDPIALQIPHLWQTIVLRTLQGRFDDISDLMGAVEQLAPTVPPELHLDASLAWVKLEMGRTEQARAHLERAASAKADPLSMPHSLLPLAVQAMVARATHDEGLARGLVEQLETFASRHVVGGFGTFVLGPVVRYQGLALAALGRAGEAEAKLETALDAARSLGARPFECMLRVELAELLLGAHGGGARVRGREHAQVALAEAESLGMQAVAARARTRLG